MTDHTGMVYVYGVVAAEGSEPPKADGIEAAPVRLVGGPPPRGRGGARAPHTRAAPHAGRPHRRGGAGAPTSGRW